MFAPSNKCSSIFVDIMTFPQFTSLNLPNEKSFSRVANALLILYIFYFRVHFYDATKSVRRRTGYDPHQLHMPRASPLHNYRFKHYLYISTSFTLCTYSILRSLYLTVLLEQHHLYTFVLWFDYAYTSTRLFHKNVSMLSSVLYPLPVRLCARTVDRSFAPLFLKVNITWT